MAVESAQGAGVFNPQKLEGGGEACGGGAEQEGML